MDQQLLDVLSKKGYADLDCNKIVVGECAPGTHTPGEVEFFHLLNDRLRKEKDVLIQDFYEKDFPMYPLPTADQYKLMFAFGAMNVLKALRFVGIRLGPDFIDQVPFPIWRPAVWNCPKAAKGWGFIGVAAADPTTAAHPFDYARSTRYNSCLMIRECPAPELLSSDEYLKHHVHGLHGFARMMTLSFIDIDPVKRVFRYYCIQGCSQLYSYDDLLHDDHTFAKLKAKIIVKGRIPRTQDFLFRTRESWEESGLGRPMIQAAQRRMLQLMANLAPLLPIKMSVAQLAHHCVMDIAAITLSQFLDGRTGMSYGFLAYQLPSGPVEDCKEVKILCTRSGCDKQNPHENNDWVVLSADTTDLFLQQAAEMKDTTSPSFDSWLILAQAAANVSLAARFKREGICSKYIDMVENQGVALCHFHGFVQRSAVPKNIAFFGHDQLPLPCGSVESAYLTVREKRSIGEKVVACGNAINYMGDIHVEPDHGSVVSCGFDTLEELTKPGNASYGLVNFKTYDELTWDPTATMAQ